MFIGSRLPVMGGLGFFCILCLRLSPTISTFVGRDRDGRSTAIDQKDAFLRKKQEWSSLGSFRHCLLFILYL